MTQEKELDNLIADLQEKHNAKVWEGDFDIGWASARLRCNGKSILSVPVSSEMRVLQGKLIFIEKKKK